MVAYLRKLVSGITFGLFVDYFFHKIFLNGVQVRRIRSGEGSGPTTLSAKHSSSIGIDIGTGLKTTLPDAKFVLSLFLRTISFRQVLPYWPPW